MKKKNKIFTVITVAVILLLFFGIFSQTLRNNNNKEDYMALNDGWHIEINEKVYENVTLNGFKFPAVNKGDIVKMSCALPNRDIVKNPILRVYTEFSTLEVVYSNGIKYQYGYELKESNHMLGYGYHFIHIPAYYATAKLELIMHVTENNAFKRIKVPYICNNDVYIRDFIISNRIPLAVNMFLIVFGILIFFTSLIFSIKDRKFLKLLYVGGFSLSIGSWSMCNYNLHILFSYDMRVKSYVEFAALYLIGLFILLYFWNEKLVNRSRKVTIGYYILLGIQICFDIVVFGLQIANIAHFPTFLSLQHIILVVCCVWIILVVVYDIIKRQLQNKILILGMGIMVVIGFIDLIFYLFVRNYYAQIQYTSILCIGAMIFVIAQIADFGMEIGNILLAAARTQALEDMAYHDDMTGIANRRSCEELWDKLDKGQNDYGIYSFDLNFLKKTNDTKGHAMGDKLIKTFSNVLSKTFGETGLVGRIGGDEFVVIIPDMTNVDINILEQRLEKEINKANIENEDLVISTAYGFCRHNQYPEYDARKIYRKADEFMYEKKVAMKAARTD